MSTQSPTWPKAIPGWLNATICGTFATLLWLEHRRPLRRQTERKLTRNSRNLAMVALSAMTIWLTERLWLVRWRSSSNVNSGGLCSPCDSRLAQSGPIGAPA